MKYFVSICVAVFVFISSASALSEFLNKNSPSLQSLIDNAKAGDTIQVSTGIYNGDITISKKLSLIGIGKTIIHGSGNGSVILLSADSCIVKGFIIEHSGKMLVDEDAGILIKSKHNVIDGNELKDVLFGIYLFKSDSNRIINNNISGRKLPELGERGSGIHIWDSHYNYLSGNVITDSRDGFYIQNANHTLVENNQVYAVRYGLHYMYADSNTFLYNRFYDNVAGAAVMYSHGITIKHNVFLHNRGFASFGILFQDCRGMIVDSNVVSDNNVGMFFEATRNNLFKNNVIARNDAALEMFQNSTGNIFTENNFIDNLSPLILIGKQTESHWSKDGKGNYWSSYEGYDLNNDGIGDVPMKIQNVFNYIESQSPNIRLYLYSPASQALATATKTFPILQLNSEIDTFPLMYPVNCGNNPAVKLSAIATTDLHQSSPESISGIFLFTCVSSSGGILYWRLARRKKYDSSRAS